MRAVGATSSRSATSRSSAYMFTWTRTTPGPIPLVTRGSTEGSERETGLEVSMNTQIETDVLIVGSGPAGGSAALPEHVWREECGAHQVPLDREQAAGAHHEPAHYGNIARHGRRGGSRREVLAPGAYEQ